MARAAVCQGGTIARALGSLTEEKCLLGERMNVLGAMPTGHEGLVQHGV